MFVEAFTRFVSLDTCLLQNLAQWPHIDTRWVEGWVCSKLNEFHANLTAENNTIARLKVALLSIFDQRAVELGSCGFGEHFQNQSRTAAQNARITSVRYCPWTSRAPLAQAIRRFATIRSKYCQGTEQMPSAHRAAAG